MYFPYLRGKQFELLALREISHLMASKNNKVSPIIEPVKGDTSALMRSLRELGKYDINFNIIVNPSVGDLVNKSNKIIQDLKQELKGYSNFQIAFLINSDLSWSLVESVHDYLEHSGFEYNGITLIHEYQSDAIEKKKSLTDHVKYNIINNSKTSRRYYRNFPSQTRVSLDDYFNSLARNSDYRHNEDEMYTDEYKFYKDEGFVGFADYLTIGSGWSEGGFIPYAVVIHLTYPTSSALRIRHFVCDSIEDASDTAGKFSEALTKLVRWLPGKNCNTETTREFRELHANDYFPGLGRIKKMSIKHHIEVVLDLV